MSQQVTLEELKALKAALDQTHEGLHSIVKLGENKRLFRTPAYLNMLNDHFTGVTKSIQMSRKLVEVEIENYEKTKNMNGEEKAMFYALSALEDMREAMKRSAENATEKPSQEDD